jgi:hypothetical protein
VLPVLTSLDFRGITKQLEGLLVRIKNPRRPRGYPDHGILQLNGVCVPHLRKSVCQIEMQNSHYRKHSICAVSICFTQSGAPTRLKFDFPEHKKKKKVQNDGIGIKYADTEVCSYKTQVSSAVSNTTITLERFCPYVSLRTSTTSELICNVKFLVIVFKASECTLQGYSGVASTMYVVSWLGARNGTKNTEC